jgi:hypothetical protein
MPKVPSYPLIRIDMVYGKPGCKVQFDESIKC